MEMRDYFGILVLLCAAGNAVAHVPPHNTNLVDQIKPNPTTRSKPTAEFSLSGYRKLAAVEFLSSGKDFNYHIELDVKTQCMALGYAVLASKCSGDLVPSRLCSLEDSIAAGDKTEAAKYTTGCCDKKVYQVTDPNLCSTTSNYTNSSYSGDYCVLADGVSRRYQCACDRARYPFGPDNTCGSQPYDEKNMCQADGKTYYARCCDTSIYNKECKASEHLSGNGDYCRRNGKDYYNSCSCHPDYHVTCTTWLYDTSNVCTNDSGVKLTTSSNCYNACTQEGYEDLQYYFRGSYTDGEGEVRGWLEKIYDRNQDATRENN